MDHRDFSDIVALIKYKPGWTIFVERDDKRSYVQIAVSAETEAAMDPTGKTDVRTPWKSGKRYLSPHMCRQEVVGVVFGLIKDAEMHEVHEWFRYRGSSIYNPHLDPEVLAEVASRKSSFIVRENAMTMVEARPKASLCIWYNNGCNCTSVTGCKDRENG